MVQGKTILVPASAFRHWLGLTTAAEMTGTVRTVLMMQRSRFSSPRGHSLRPPGQTASASSQQCWSDSRPSFYSHFHPLKSTASPRLTGCNRTLCRHNILPAVGFCPSLRRVSFIILWRGDGMEEMSRVRRWRGVTNSLCSGGAAGCEDWAPVNLAVFQSVIAGTCAETCTDLPLGPRSQLFPLVRAQMMNGQQLNGLKHVLTGGGTMNVAHGL